MYHYIVVVAYRGEAMAEASDRWDGQAGNPSRVVERRTVEIRVARVVGCEHFSGSTRIRRALVEDTEGTRWILSGQAGPAGLLRACDIQPGSRFRLVLTRTIETDTAAAYCGRAEQAATL